MISIYSYSPSSFLSPSFIKYNLIAGSIPRVLYLGGDLIEGLDFEGFAEFLLLMDLAIFGFFNFSTQVDFQSDEWH